MFECFEGLSVCVFVFALLFFCRDWEGYHHCESTSTIVQSSSFSESLAHSRVLVSCERATVGKPDIPGQNNAKRYKRYKLRCGPL